MIRLKKQPIAVLAVLILCLVSLYAAPGLTAYFDGLFSNLLVKGQATFPIATGTAPMVVTSTTKVSNLNVDKLDDYDWAAPAAIGSTTPAAGAFTTGSFTGLVTMTGGYDLPVTAKTANYTVAAADMGTIFSNTGASGEITFVFPEASTVIGQPIWFCVAAAHTINVDFDAADKMLSICNAAGDKVQNTGTAGNIIGMAALDSTNIVTFGAKEGTWSDAN